MNSTPSFDSMNECIENCLDCHRKCLETLNYCLHEGLEQTDTVQLLKNCAALCIVTTQFIISQSRLHSVLSGVCADVCAACASSCEEFEGDDVMQDCAEICRRCESSCREMSRIGKDMHHSPEARAAAWMKEISMRAQRADQSGML